MDFAFLGLLCLTFVLGVLAATAWVQVGSYRQKAREVVVYDHDGHPVSVPTTEVDHWLIKGFVKTWVAPPTEAE